MYVKVIKATGDWRYGVEYMYSTGGSVFRVNPDAGFALRAAGLAILATNEEIDQAAAAAGEALPPGGRRCDFQLAIHGPGAAVTAPPAPSSLDLFQLCIQDVDAKEAASV